MSDYELDLDQILAEFNADAPETSPGERPERSESATLSRRARREAAERAAEAARRPIREEPEALPEEDDAAPEMEDTVDEAPVRRRSRPEKKATKKKKAPARVSRYEDDDYEEDDEGAAFDAYEEPRPRDPDRRHPLLVLLCWLLFALCLCFSALNLHPTISTSSGRASQQTAVQPVAVTPAPVEPTPAALEPAPTLPPENPAVVPEVTPEPTPEPVHYTIPEGALVAPAPRMEDYGSAPVDDPAPVLAVIQQARESGLVAPDEQTVFERNTSSGTHEFYRGAQAKDILYYRDDTILVILWKEQIDGNSVTFTEVKIADGSQLRRKFTEDTFGSYNSDYASQLAAATNAVVAMNADYYLFRDFGMVAYNRELFRFNTGSYDGTYSKYNCVDTLFVTAGGDFLYKRLGEQNTWDSIQQFIWDNDVVFSVAFGPVLVENGQALPCDWYPVGEVNSGYSRAGIGQVDKLHYLYLSLNHSNEKEARWTVSTFAQHFAEQGVQTAYCLDGGQTGEVVFRGEPYNHIDFGSERLVSDILYFATALPEEGGMTP